MTLGFAPQPGRPITIVRNTGPAFISGTFSGVPQGGTVPLVHNGVTYNYIANYFGENGRSFVLQWPLVQMVAWGDNSDGQLGNGSIGADSIGVPTPVKVVIPPALAGKTVVEVAAGNGFSLALTSQGKVFSWGSSSYGSLGRGMVGDSLFAVEVMFGGMLSGKTVVAIEAGGGHALALTSAGEVISWGYNADGQLGTGSTDYSVAIPVMLDRAHFGSMPVVAISAGTNHSMALTSDGRVFCWGCDSDGQLGSGQRSFTSYPRVPVEVESDEELSGVAFVSIDAGDRHSLALAADGRLFAWGDMSKWVDDGLYSRTSYRPTVVDMNGVLAGKSMSSISAGSSNLVLSQDGEVFSWGRNYYGQLGDGTTTERLVPIAAGPSGLIDGKKVSFIASGLSHGVAVTADGKCHTWGSNNNGQLGNNSNINSSLPVTVSEGDRGAFAGLRTISVSASGSHNLALLDAGPPSIDVTPANRTAAAGATVTFSSSVIPSFDSTVRWQVSNSGPTGTFIDITENPTATTPNLVLPEVSSSQHNQAFRAVFTNISGSTATPPAILKITEWSATLVSASTVPFVSDGPVDDPGKHRNSLYFGGV